MKKSKTVFMVTMLVALFAAVVIILPIIFMPGDDAYAPEVVAQQPTELDLIKTLVTDPPRPQWQPPQLTREQFLEDFDYLMTALKENVPTFGIIYRRNEVDMLALVPELRERILDESIEWDYIPFWEMLRLDFFSHASPVGHLWLASYDTYFRSAYERFDNRRRTVYSYFGDRLANPTFDEKHLYHSQMVTPLLGFDDYNITTNIIEDGRIAYIRLPRIYGDNWVRNPASDTLRQVDEFYSQLEGFEHLILDMRGIYGGYTEFFTRPLIAPLIDYPLETIFHQFYMAGEYNTRLMRRAPRSMGERVPFNIDDLPNIFPEVTLSEDVVNDLRLMDYYISRTVSIAPHPERRAPFNGKVWLLTDMNNFSAAQQIAAFLHQTGFATLVGQTTGGMVSDAALMPAFITLPNTTFEVRYDMLYIISADGRPWEYGTVPHHFNRDGMDALQTVLALIAEGNW